MSSPRSRRPKRASLFPGFKPEDPVVPGVTAKVRDGRKAMVNSVLPPTMTEGGVVVAAWLPSSLR